MGLFRFVALLSIVAVASASKRKSLVLIDDTGRQNSHSKFIQSLRSQYDVTVSLATSSSLEIKKYGEFLFDNIVLLCPETKNFGGEIDEAALLDFVDGGKSLIIAGSTTATNTIRELSSDCGVDFDPKKTVVMDHIHYDVTDSGSHTVIVADGFSSSAILKGFNRTPILFQGIGLSIGTNPLVTALVHGGPTVYSANPAEPIDKKPTSAGKQTVLVAGVQTRGAGRVLVSGSIDLFSDKFIDARIKGSQSGNSAFIDVCVGWALQDRGVLRARDLKHSLQGGLETPRMYRVKDDISFSIVIEEFDGHTGTYKPYVADDVQLEFRMLDPYVRTFLKPLGNGTFSVDFRVPDVYGVFKFHIDYRRDGYSHVVVSQEIGVRPFRHNEFERFIVSANPYYLSSGLMMAGFVLFSFVFLFTKEKEKQS